MSDNCQLLRLAAEQGDADAQFNLGVMYERGRGVPVNDILAHMWFNIAATNGNEGGRENLEIIQNRVTASDTSEARARARVCFASGYKDCGA